MSFVQTTETAELTAATAANVRGGSRDSGKVDAIQYARAIAAMLVVFYHQTMYLSRIARDSTLHDIFGGRPGLYGVVAFFVLSGYLMADIAPKYAPFTFLVHRIIRIYPTYWLCVAIAIPFFGVLWFVTKPNADFVPNIQVMLFGHGLLSRDVLRLTLAPMVFPDFPLGIEWTLLYETTFYVIIFAVSISGRIRFLPYLAIGWLALIVWCMWNYPAGEANYTTPTLATLPFFGINAGFIFGILGAHVREKVPAMPAIIGGLLLLVLVEVLPNRLAMVQTAGGLAAIVIGLLTLERQGRVGSFKSLRRLGDWSYAMYLVHVPVILATFKLMHGKAGWLVLVTSTVLVIAASAILGKVDVAAYYRLKRVLDGGPAAVRAFIAAAFVLVFISAAVLTLPRL